MVFGGNQPCIPACCNPDLESGGAHKELCKVCFQKSALLESHRIVGEVRDRKQICLNNSNAHVAHVTYAAQKIDAWLFIFSFLITPFELVHFLFDNQLISLSLNQQSTISHYQLYHTINSYITVTKPTINYITLSTHISLSLNQQSTISHYQLHHTINYITLSTHNTRPTACKHRGRKHPAGVWKPQRLAELARAQHQPPAASWSRGAETRGLDTRGGGSGLEASSRTRTGRSGAPALSDRRGPAAPHGRSSRTSPRCPVCPRSVG
eukprot:jgi/Antlo1/172/1524